MLDFFLNLDVRTLILVLFSGNLVSVGLICAFYYATETGRDWESSRSLFLAKAFQACGFCLMFQREFISPLVSVNLGNTLVFAGFYFEAVAMLRLLNEARFARVILLPIAAIAVLGFNFLELLYPDPSLRVATASICILLILPFPCLRLFVSENTGRFKQWVGVWYLAVLILFFARAVHALTTDISLFSNSYVQTLTFLAMVLQLVFSLPAFLLLIKEDTDQIIASMATTDMLTGLANRYAFLDAAQRVFLRSRISGGSVAVLFIDIDFFKAINDTHGHAFGDQVLAELGRSIRDCLRPTDISCRYGGEEFVLLLHDADSGGAVTVAERIRAHVSGIVFPEKPDVRFTLSIGISGGVPVEGENLDLFVGRADSALYMAKRAGRDRIVEYDPVSAFVSDI
jgi:diguanylate cyclase (GGDEF)-like protein